MTKPKYELSIDLNALNHLGINLYSNLPAVISEVVANSWDAEARTVSINIDSTAGIVTITDDGFGMDENDINSKYLKVGYRKRLSDGARTPNLKRHVMGRKGIGKLSLFSIADEVEVQSAKHASPVIRNGFIMRTADIKAKIGSNSVYHPETIPDANLTVSKGTRIVLRQLKKNAALAETYLRQKLARRFSVIGPEHDFSVSVNGDPITVADRKYYDKIEFLWYFGDEGARVAKLCKKAKKKIELPNVVNVEAGYTAAGWIGTFDERASIDDGNNTIVVNAWGKLAQEDLLKDLDEGGLFTKYLIGEVRADFIDADDLADIATSDRQRLLETDPRFSLLKSFVNDIIKKHVKLNWTKWRREGAADKALENKAVKAWFDSLGKDHKAMAREMFGTIESMAVPDIEVKRELYKQSILAFETLAFKNNLSALKDIDTAAELGRLAEVIGNMDELEAVRYYQIVKGRVEVLRKFEHVKTDALEKVIQQLIFDHLWLLDPSWERASTDPAMEENVGKAFSAVSAKLSKEEKKSRLDIRYRTAAGKNVVIELKRYNRKVSVAELVDQVGKYRGALQKVLAEKHPDQAADIEFICLLGSAPTGMDIQAARNVLKGVDARYITYDDLLKQTRDSYADYLEAEQKVAKIEQIIASI